MTKQKKEQLEFAGFMQEARSDDWYIQKYNELEKENIISRDFPCKFNFVPNDEDEDDPWKSLGGQVKSERQKYSVHNLDPHRKNGPFVLQYLPSIKEEGKKNIQLLYLVINAEVDENGDPVEKFDAYPINRKKISTVEDFKEMFFK